MNAHVARMKRALALAATVSLAGLTAGCGEKTQAATTPAAAPPQIPEGEVWLTPAQVRDAKIQLADVNEEPVDDTILTSGTVTFDDLRTAHVFSPVTGRVVNITAQLGSAREEGRRPGRHRVARHRQRLRRPAQGAGRPHRGRTTTSSARRSSSSRRPARRRTSRRRRTTYRKAKAEVERARQKERALRRGQRRLGVRRPTRSRRPSTARSLIAQHQPGHRGAGAVHRRRHAGALHHRRARSRLGHRRPLRDGSSPACKIGAPAVRHGRGVPRQGRSRARSTGSAAASTRSRAPPRCAAPFENPDRFLRPDDVRHRPDLGRPEEGAGHPARRRAAPRRAEGRLRPGGRRADGLCVRAHARRRRRGRVEPVAPGEARASQPGQKVVITGPSCSRRT